MSVLMAQRLARRAEEPEVFQVQIPPRPKTNNSIMFMLPVESSESTFDQKLWSTVE